MGFSILSLIEIFYYVTLRLGCTIKKKRVKRKNKKFNSDVPKNVCKIVQCKQ